MTTPIVPTSVRTVFEGRVFTVQVESITLPKGVPLDAEIVRHPGSVVIVPVTDTNEIVLARQYRHAIGRYTWEVPAGSLEPGEDPRVAAARECQEEIGMIAERVEPLGSFFPTPGYCDEEMHFFLLTGLRAPREGDAAALPDDDEDIEPRSFSPAEIRGMIARGEIVDLKTVAGVTLAQASGLSGESSS
jgi:ADP-ribose pyrophosphatase